MYIILADDEKYSYLLGAAQSVFTKNFINNHVFVCEYLGDAIGRVESLDYVDVGIFDIDFAPKEGMSKVSYGLGGQISEGEALNDHLTNLMGINLLIASISKAQEKGSHFIGCLYTYYDKSQLRSRSLDMRIFIKYQLPQWKEQVDLWKAGDGKFEEIIADKIRKMLRKVRKKYFSLIENYPEFRAKVDRLRNDLDRDISTNATADAALVKRKDLEQRFDEIKQSLKFKPGSRQFTFETFFPEFGREIEELLSDAKKPGKLFGNPKKQRLFKVLTAFIFDWKPYTSILTNLVRRDGKDIKEGAYHKKWHSGFTKEHAAQLARVEEFEMLPRHIIDDLNNNDACRDYRINGLVNLLEKKIKEIQAANGNPAPEGPAESDGTLGIILEFLGVKHSIAIELPDSKALAEARFSIDTKKFCDCFSTLLLSEILKHGFGKIPDDCEPIKEKIVHIGFEQTVNRELGECEYDEYALTVGDNGYGFSGSAFKIKGRGDLARVIEYASLWCEEMHIETRYDKNGDWFKYDLFKNRESAEVTPSPKLSESSGTIYHFIFRVRDQAV